MASPAETARCGQVGGEANGLTIVTGAKRSGELRGFGRDGAQFERSLAAEQN